MGFDMVILTPYKVNGSFLPNDRLHKNSYTLLYTAIVTSGIKSRTSSRAANGLGVAEFHFDSNKKDVLAGATKIGRKFIRSDVDVLVTDAMGNVLVDKSVACRLK
jgi:hypothetical protein